MAKYKVKLKYALWHFEEYVIDTEDLAANAEDGPWNKEDQALLEACPMDFCCEETQTSKGTGDVFNGTWEETLTEIPVLDRILEAVNDDA